MKGGVVKDLLQKKHHLPPHHPFPTFVLSIDILKLDLKQRKEKSLTPQTSKIFFERKVLNEFSWSDHIPLGKRLTLYFTLF
jgi:hypothetical protein